MSSNDQENVGQPTPMDNPSSPGPGARSPASQYTEDFPQYIRLTPELIGSIHEYSEIKRTLRCAEGLLRAEVLQKEHNITKEMTENLAEIVQGREWNSTYEDRELIVPLDATPRPFAFRSEVGTAAFSLLPSEARAVILRMYPSCEGAFRASLENEESDLGSNGSGDYCSV